MPETEPMVRFNSSRFGDLEVPENKIVVIPEGIIGFRDFNRYALLDPSGGDSVFIWLHSIEEPDLAFIIADPSGLAPDYTVESSEPDIVRLGLDPSEGYGLFVIITVPPDNPDMINANLVAPIIYRKSDNCMFQVVLEKGGWPLKYFFLEEQNPEKGPGDASSDSGGVE